MKNIPENWTTLTAGDLMSRDVLVIPQRMSLRAAANLLSRSDVSGAPVVGGDGACIGVLSATDFVHRADSWRKSRFPSDCEIFVGADWPSVEIDLLPAEDVGAHMTADPVMVAPETTIQEIARAMVDAHIHRVIVADAFKRPIGVVSSIDVLAAVARAETSK